MKIIFETKEEYEDFVINYLARNNKFILTNFEPDFGNDVDICTANFVMEMERTHDISREI